MAKKEKLIDDFIELRIEGKTFEEISELLGVSKQSLLEWNKDFEVRKVIELAKTVKYQSILKAYEMNREAKIEAMASLSQRINLELANRDLSDLSTDKLLKMAILNEERLKGLLPVFKLDQLDVWGAVFEGNSVVVDPED